jgi:hypothetical protein
MLRRLKKASSSNHPDHCFPPFVDESTKKNTDGTMNTG